MDRRGRLLEVIVEVVCPHCGNQFWTRGTPTANSYCPRCFYFLGECLKPCPPTPSMADRAIWKSLKLCVPAGALTGPVVAAGMLLGFFLIPGPEIGPVPLNYIATSMFAGVCGLLVGIPTGIVIGLIRGLVQAGSKKNRKAPSSKSVLLEVGMLSWSIIATAINPFVASIAASSSPT